MALDLTLRRQVQLLEQLGCHADARRRAKPIQRLGPLRVGVDAMTLFLCHCR